MAYRMAAQPDTLEIVAAIRDNDKDLFIEKLLKSIRFRGCIITEQQLERRMLIIDDVLCLCTIYNRPEILAKCGSVVALSSNYGENTNFGERSLSLAQHLGYQDCWKELAKLFPNKYNSLSHFQLTQCNDAHLPKLLLYLDKLYHGYDSDKCNIDTDVFKTTCKRFLGNNINELNTSGETFLHEVICEKLNVEKLSSLLEIGCDINMLDRRGQTAFLVFCREQNPTDPHSAQIRSIDFTRKLQLLIMENPSVRLSKSADYHVLMHEMSEFKEKHRREPTNSELLSFPPTTLLHKHGFDFSYTYVIRCRQPNVERRTLLHRVRLAHGVRKLSEICRIMLRQHYTGKAIHSFVKGDNIPKRLKDYILLKDMIHLQ